MRIGDGQATLDFTSQGPVGIDHCLENIESLVNKETIIGKKEVVDPSAPPGDGNTGYPSLSRSLVHHGTHCLCTKDEKIG
jgi:hypothetical protein